MDRLPARFERAEWLHLAPDEEVLWAGHPSFVPYLPRYLLGSAFVLGGLLGMAVLDAWNAGLLGVGAVVIGILIAAQSHYGRVSTGYVITTTQVYHKEGLISRDVTQIRYDRIQNTSFSQSITERLLSYGDVVITSAGTGEVEILLRSVPEPARIKRLLTEQLDDHGRTDARTRTTGSVVP